MATTPEFAQVLEHLRDASSPFPPIELYQFSDLSRQDLAALEAVWPQTPLERRRSVMQDLGEIGEANFEVRFDDVYRLGLQDEDAEVRTLAIQNLWESEAPDLIAPFLDLMQQDPSAEVRAAAASALGRFVYLGEIDDIPARHARRVEDSLLAVITGNDELEVRRRALEAVAFSGRPEVPPLIEQAFHSPERLLHISALFAMGRSADARWSADVLSEMESVDPEFRFEAVRAAGELEIPEAVPTLSELVNDVDTQVREAAIWSLGQIGGDEARHVLTDLLAEAEDDERDFIEEAMQNLIFHDELMHFDLFDFEDDDTVNEFDEGGDEIPPINQRLN